MRIKIASAALLMAELGGLAAPVFASNAASSSSAATGKNISETTALEDLSTDEAFDEADYPAKAALGKDAFGKDESEWQAIACTDGLADFSQTYFYFYHPLANPPKWTDSASGNETYDVAFRLSMATTGSLDAYVHYSLELKNSSQDLRFFKFVLNFDFAPKMEAASYRCYDISEFEIVDQATTHSNAYKVAKRFSWTYQTDGSFKENSQSIDTIELTPHFASFVIAGINGTTDEVGHGIPLTTTPYTGEPDRVENWLAGTSGGLIPDWSTYARETTSFFAAFPVPKTMGKLCGADVSYRMANDYGLYGSVALLPNLFDQNALRSITTNPSAQISLNRAKLQADNPAMWKSESKTVRLSTGLDSDWVGVSDMSPTVAAKKFSAAVAWYKDRGAWSLGYADAYDLPAIQKLSPLSGYDFVKDSNFDRSSTNPYAIDSGTAEWLKTAYSGGGFASNDYYILRFEMRNLSIMSTPFIRSVFYGSPVVSSYAYGYEKWDSYDTDVLDLHFYLNGSFYTIGVVADSGVIITDPTPGFNTDSLFSFNWRIVLIVVTGIALIVITWWVVNFLKVAFGGKKDG